MDSAIMSMHQQKRATVSIWIIMPKLFKFCSHCIQMFLSQFSNKIYKCFYLKSFVFFQFYNCSVNIYNKWTLQRVVCVTIIVTFFTDTTVTIILVLLIELCIILIVCVVLYFYSSSTRQLFSAPEGNFSSWQAAVSMTSCKNLLMRHSFGISNASRILAGYQIIDFTFTLLYFWNRARLDSVLPHWTHSVRTIQWSVIQDGTCDFRRSSRFGSWADPFPHLHSRSSTRGPKAWFSTFMHTRTTCRSAITRLHRAWPACCNEWPSVSRMSPPGCPRIDYASIPRRLNSSGWDHLDGFRTVPRTPKWAFWDLSFVRSTRSEISVCSSTAALPCLIMSTKSPRCVTSIFDNFPSCDEHWRMRLHTPWYELSSTSGLITATVFWLPVRNTSLRSYSPCFLSPPDSSYDCPVARLFPLWCAINFTGWASNQEWSLSWLSWLTSRFTVWLRSTCLLTVFQCRVCQVAHIFDLLVSGPCWSPELRLWQFGPRGFYCSCPSVWNSLPASLRDFNLSLETFRQKLKLHLFTS